MADINQDQYNQVKNYLIQNNQQELAGYVDQMWSQFNGGQ
jgi:hypothetical protein